MSATASLIGCLDLRGVAQGGYWQRDFLRRALDRLVAGGAALAYHDRFGVVPPAIGEGLLLGGGGLLDLYDASGGRRGRVPTGTPGVVTLGLSVDQDPPPGAFDTVLHASFGAADLTARFEGAPHKHEGEIAAMAASLRRADRILVPSVPEGLHLVTHYGVAFSDVVLLAPPVPERTRRAPAARGGVVLHFCDAIDAPGAAFARAFARAFGEIGGETPVVATQQATGAVRPPDLAAGTTLRLAEPLQADELTRVHQGVALTVFAPTARPCQVALSRAVASGGAVLAPLADAFALASAGCHRYYPASAAVAAATAYDVLTGAASRTGHTETIDHPFTDFDALLRELLP